MKTRPILMMTIVTRGSMTPPVGVAMCTMCSLFDTPIEECMRDSLPFFLAIFALVLMLLAFPAIPMTLPDLMFGGEVPWRAGRPRIIVRQGPGEFGGLRDPKDCVHRLWRGGPRIPRDA